MLINGKKLLIVGGAAGIGAAIAIEAARRGAEVAITDISADGLRTVSDQISGEGGIAHTMTADLSDDASVAAMAEWCLTKIGPPDLLLVTVIEYSSTFSGVADMAVAEWKKAFEINFFGYIRVLEHLLEPMRERGEGVIALTASTVALLPDPTAAILMRYKAIKHALVGLSQSLAIALERSGLRSISFCPSLTATPTAIGNLRKSELPGVEEIISIAATAEDVANLFLEKLEGDDFLICAHEGYRDLLVELARDELDPKPFIANHFPSGD